MKILAILILVAVVVMFYAVTSILHGQVDFATPAFEYDFGSYKAIMFFKTSTAIRFGGTYFIFSVPFYILAVGVAAIPFCFWSLFKKRKHEAVA